jgi:hypothetical protein
VSTEARLSRAASDTHGLPQGFLKQRVILEAWKLLRLWCYAWGNLHCSRVRASFSAATTSAASTRRECVRRRGVARGVTALAGPTHLCGTSREGALPLGLPSSSSNSRWLI